MGFLLPTSLNFATIAILFNLFKNLLTIVATLSTYFLVILSLLPNLSRLKSALLIGAGSGVPGGAQAPPELFLAPPEPFEPPLTIKKIMH